MSAALVRPRAGDDGPPSPASRGGQPVVTWVKAVRPQALDNRMRSRPKSQSTARMSRSKPVKLFRRGAMRAAFRISLLAIGLASLLGSGGAWAGALLEFPN